MDELNGGGLHMAKYMIHQPHNPYRQDSNSVLALLKMEMEI